MTNQKSLSLTLDDIEIPEQWREKYLIKRIGEDDIEISLEARDSILKALAGGARFVQIGKYTLMVNAIKSIDPKWGPQNIPPRPQLREKTESYLNESTQTFNVKVIGSNIEEIELYDKIFGDKPHSLK